MWRPISTGNSFTSDLFLKYYILLEHQIHVAVGRFEYQHMYFGYIYFCSIIFTAASLKFLCLLMEVLSFWRLPVCACVYTHTHIYTEREEENFL